MMWAAVLIQGLAIIILGVVCLLQSSQIRRLAKAGENLAQALSVIGREVYGDRWRQAEEEETRQ